MLDTIARCRSGSTASTRHGTGHGVGYFLNVHEGPQSFSRVIPDATMAMQPGMITSVEPGLYRPGQWGVRVENLVLSVPAGGVSSEFGEFLEFETLTLCPIDARCLEPSLLRADEIAWLNAYHVTVRERLAPLVSGDALAWLTLRTAPPYFRSSAAGRARSACRHGRSSTKISRRPPIRRKQVSPRRGHPRVRPSHPRMPSGAT